MVWDLKGWDLGQTYGSKVAEKGLKYLASATHDLYTINDLQFNLKREKKKKKGGGGGMQVDTIS